MTTMLLDRSTVRQFTWAVEHGWSLYGKDGDFIWLLYGLLPSSS